jgi:hypothetical protein
LAGDNSDLIDREFPRRHERWLLYIFHLVLHSRRQGEKENGYENNQAGEKDDNKFNPFF